jgi:hypothetical protein
LERTTYQTYGGAGFLEELRGKGITGPPHSKDLSAEKKLEKGEARNITRPESNGT